MVRRTKIIRTLLVEDNAIFRKTLKEILSSRFSMMIEEATRGREAIRKIESFCPDIIFMDIKLPDENGLTLTKRVRKSKCDATIIILTNYDLPEYREAARLNGADYFLSKGSSSAQEIIDLVDSISSKRSSASEMGKKPILRPTT